MEKRELKDRKLDALYESIFGDVSRIIEVARHQAARSVNAVLTAAYWLIGRRIVEFEQAGEKRAEYGSALIERLAADLTPRFGRGFSRQNIQQMRLFYLFYPAEQIRQTLSGELGQPLRQPICRTVSGKLRTVSAENIDGLVIGYLKILFGILFTIIANRVQIVPPILTECQCNRN